MKIKGIKGIVDLTINKSKITKQNTITVLGDMFFKSKATQGISALRGVEEGFDFIQSALVSMSSTIATLNLDTFTVYLLNLTDAEKLSLTAQSQELPIYKQGTYEIEHSKIVGWASVDRTSTQAKQGVFDARAGEEVVNEWTSSLAWTWAAGKATGTFNTIAIGVNVLNNRYNGISVYRGLEENDTVAGQTAPSGFMLRPGVTGITGASEILLGGATTTGQGRVKYDFITKSRVELKTGDVGYDFPLSKANSPQIVTGTKLFYFKDNYVWVYDTTSKTHTNTNIYGYFQTTLFLKGGYLYVAGDTSTLYAYDTNTYTNVASANLAIASIVIPDDMLVGVYKAFSYIAIANYDNAKYIISRYNTGTVGDKKSIVVTDLLTQSTVKILPRVSSGVNYTINNEIFLFDYDAEDDLYKNLQIGTGTVSNFGRYGVKYSKYSGNMISFLTYPTNQTILADDIPRVEYSYTYGNN